MIIIEIKEGETLDRALRRFKKKFEKLGILKRVRKRMYYTPPSVHTRDEIKRAVRRQQFATEAESQ